MRKTLLIASLLLSAGLAHAQVTSPLGGSTTNPQTPPPASHLPRRATSSTPTTAPATTAPATTAPATTTTETAPAAATSGHHHRLTPKQRFEQANTTHDGKLTKAQAEAGHMRSVVRDFDQIDTAKRGYVTWDQVRDFQKKRREERRAARASEATTKPATTKPATTSKP